MGHCLSKVTVTSSAPADLDTSFLELGILNDLIIFKGENLFDPRVSSFNCLRRWGRFAAPFSNSIANKVRRFSDVFESLSKVSELAPPGIVDQLPNLCPKLGGESVEKLLMIRKECEQLFLVHVIQGKVV